MFVAYLTRLFNGSKECPPSQPTANQPKRRELDEFGDPIDDMDLTPEEREIAGRFNDAANVLPRIVGELEEKTVLRLYALYKQATAGRADPKDRPSMLDIRGRTKFDAWYSLGDLEKFEAMREYAERISSVAGTSTEQKKSSQGFGMRPSIMQRTEADANLDSDDPNAVWFKAAQEGDLDTLKRQLETSAELLEAKDNALGMTALLWATDAGQKEAVELLLGNGADLSAIDDDGSSAMDLAATCEHEEILELLKKHGAKETIND